MNKVKGLLIIAFVFILGGCCCGSSSVPDISGNTKTNMVSPLEIATKSRAMQEKVQRMMELENDPNMDPEELAKLEAEIEALQKEIAEHSKQMEKELETSDDPRLKKAALEMKEARLKQQEAIKRAESAVAEVEEAQQQTFVDDIQEDVDFYQEETADRFDKYNETLDESYDPDFDTDFQDDSF